MSACGTVMPKPAAIGEIKKFTAKPRTQTCPHKGLQDDWKKFKEGKIGVNCKTELDAGIFFDLLYLLICFFLKNRVISFFKNTLIL